VWGKGQVFRDRYFASGFGERSPVPKRLKVEQMKKKGGLHRVFWPAESWMVFKV
jgi:hypothetical protein